MPYDAAVSIAVDLDDLPGQTAEFRWAYLLTVRDDQRPHVVAVTPAWQGEIPRDLRRPRDGRQRRGQTDRSRCAIRRSSDGLQPDRRRRRPRSTTTRSPFGRPRRCCTGPRRQRPEQPDRDRTGPAGVGRFEDRGSGNAGAVTKIRSSSSCRIRDRRGAGGGGLGSVAVVAVVAFRFPMKAGGGIARCDPARGDRDRFPTARNGNSSVERRRRRSTRVVRSTARPRSNRSCAARSTTCRSTGRSSSPSTFQGAFSGTDTVFFSGGTSTGCGEASAQTGPFYCPVDQLVYLDLDFLEQLQATVRRHRRPRRAVHRRPRVRPPRAEHHGHRRPGERRRSSRTPTSANDFSVALELQADCFAGAWASSVAERDLFDPRGRDRRGAERRRSGRRRPDPGAGRTTGRSRQLHPRNRGAASPLVRGRILDRRPRAVPDVQQLARAVGQPAVRPGSGVSAQARMMPRRGASPVRSRN